MGEVYLATDTKLGRKVALKFLPTAMMNDADARDRLLREAQAASRLAHPNIMTVHSIDRVNDRDFIVMEYVSGQPMNEYCQSRQHSVPELLDLAIQLAEGIERAHAAGVIHRDLKPANILVDENGRARILDFGLAKIEGAVKLTQTGSTIGTMAYFSPEQAQGKLVDKRSDLFSFGVVLYEVLANQLPFNGEHQAAVVYSLVHEQPQPLARFNRDVRDDLERLVSKCLAKKPEDRYQSVSDLLADLRSCRKAMESTSAAPQDTAPDAAKRPMLAILPFENLGPSEDEYFADGMTEEIISRMAGVKGLGVISRTSAMRYKNSDKSMREIGSELGAEFILEGSVRWGKTKEGGSRIRITPQLIRVNDDTHLWSDRYDRVLEDVFDLQSEIAEEVFEQLNVTLLEPERKAVGARRTDNVEAYNEYLKGLALARRTGFLEENFREALSHFLRATDIDAEFVVGWAAQSLVHSDLYFQGFDQTPERIELSKEAVDRALSLDPEQPFARAALGIYHYRCHHDYELAVTELEWASRRMPNDDMALLFLAAVKRRQGRFQEFIALVSRGIELNPQDAGLPYEMAFACSAMGDYDGAHRYLDLSLSIEPNNTSALGYKAWITVARDGDLSTARTYIDKMPGKFHTSWSYQHMMFLIWAGDFEAAKEYLQYLPEGIIEIQFWVYDRSFFEGWIGYFSGSENHGREALEDARSRYTEAATERPKDSRIHLALGYIHAMLGQSELAIAAGQRALEFARSFDG
jgi:non-specific serine/threonine protein kinase